MKNLMEQKENAVPTPAKFAAKVKERMETLLGDGYMINVQEAVKNNSLKLTGLLIKKEDEVGGPVIYLDNYFESFREGRDIEEICGSIMEAYVSTRTHESFEMMDFVKQITDFTYAMDKICYRLVNAEMNKEMLKNHPHRNFLDLAVYYYIPIPYCTDGSSMTSLAITDALMAAWKVDEQTLYGLAAQNTPALMGKKLTPVQEIIADLIPVCPENRGVMELPDCGLWSATNNDNLYGAAAMLDKKLLDEFASENGPEFYILPSSVHEVLFCSMKDASAGELASMVKAVNSDCLDREDILSDHVYRYSKEKETSEIAG